MLAVAAMSLPFMAILAGIIALEKVVVRGRRVVHEIRRRRVRAAWSRSILLSEHPARALICEQLSADFSRASLRPLWIRYVSAPYGPLNVRLSQKKAFCPESSKVRLGLTIRMTLVLHALAVCQMKPLGRLICVSLSSPRHGILERL